MTTRGVLSFGASDEWGDCVGVGANTTDAGDGVGDCSGDGVGDGDDEGTAYDTHTNFKSNCYNIYYELKQHAWLTRLKQFNMINYYNIKFETILYN